MLSKLRAKKLPGFTLLELVVVIVVIGILAAIAIPTFQGVIDRANDASAQTTLQAITHDAEVLYAMDQGSTPAQWYAAFAEAVAETPGAATFITADATAVIVIDKPDSDGEDVATYQAAVEATGAATPATGASTLGTISVSVDEANNLVGAAYVTSSNHCAFSTTLFDKTRSETLPAQSWSLDKNLGSNCKGTTALLGEVSTKADAENLSSSGNLQLDIYYDTGIFSQNNQEFPAYLDNAAGDEVFSITSGTTPAGVVFNTVNGSFTGPVFTPVSLQAVQVSGFYATNCIVTTLGGVKCWGDNNYGQLGDGTQNTRTTAINVQGLTSGVESVAMGGTHGCALTTSGGVKCWGSNASGQLGNGTTVDSSTPVDVQGLSSGAVSLSSGFSHSCAVTASGGLKCWGMNYYGVLGNGTTIDSSTPTAVTGLTSGVQQVAAGANHTCALTDSGAVKCWGQGNTGSLGDGLLTDSLVPVDVTGLASGVQRIESGTYGACAITTGGALKCWGPAATHLTNESTPIQIPGLTSGVTQVTVGHMVACAITSSGGMKCWGWNIHGGIGDGTTNNSATPVDVTGMTSGVVSISAGLDQSCAAIASGEVKCWGLSSLTPQSVLTYGSQPGFPATITVRAAGSNGAATTSITLVSP